MSSTAIPTISAGSWPGRSGSARPKAKVRARARIAPVAVLSGVLGQLLEAHVVDDQEIGLEVMAQEPVLLIEGLVLQEVADEIEDGGT
jgi:hypothetical protein